MVTITKINLKQDDKVQKKFLKNISVVLQKIGSSHKTKAISNLIRKEALYIGYGVTDVANKRSAQYGALYLSGNKLSGLAADISVIVEKSEVDVVSKKVKEISKANKELERIKTTITDTSSIQLKNLDNQVEKLFNDLLDTIDYFTLVDVYYYLYIDALATIGIKGNGKNKIFEVCYDIFNKAVKKILDKVHNSVKKEDEKKFSIIIDFVFAKSFTEQSTQTIIQTLSRLYSKEDVQFLKDAKPDEYERFKNIATLLTKTGIANITDNALMSNFKTIVGEGAEKAMTGTFDELVAYIISTNYKSNLFDAQRIDDKDQERLEQLILNYKKDVILPKV